MPVLNAETVHSNGLTMKSYSFITAKVHFIAYEKGVAYMIEQQLKFV